MASSSELLARRHGIRDGGWGRSAPSHASLSLDRLHFEMYAVVQMTAMSLTCGQQFASFLGIPNAAPQTRIVSGGPFGRAKGSLSRHLKYMAGTRIPEFESYMPSHPVRCPARTHR
jgi:hypothetical protein